MELYWSISGTVCVASYGDFIVVFKRREEEGVGEFKYFKTL